MFNTAGPVNISREQFRHIQNMFQNTPGEDGYVIPKEQMKLLHDTLINADAQQRQFGANSVILGTMTAVGVGAAKDIAEFKNSGKKLNSLTFKEGVKILGKNSKLAAYVVFGAGVAFAMFDKAVSVIRNNRYKDEETPGLAKTLFGSAAFTALAGTAKFAYDGIKNKMNDMPFMSKPFNFKTAGEYGLKGLKFTALLGGAALITLALLQKFFGPKVTNN